MNAVRMVLTFVAAFSITSTTWASSADFTIRGEGIDLGKPEEVYENGKPLPPRLHANVEMGKTFKLIAQGMAYPRPARGAEAKVPEGTPCEPEAGTWRVEEGQFQISMPDKKETDKTTIVIQLRPAAVGRGRVRFTGTVLGYERTFDVLVDVIAPPKK